MNEKKAHFIKDLFRDEVGEKYSSKKIWGFVCMFLVCSAYILDGFKFYTANEALFNSMLIAGTTLLGLRVLKGLVKK